ncbi:colicin E3/pyocin S6 family cytotoxin [Streptomyces sp. NPDC056308]|uniref:colicin E3/pyocin S6 family cytotoxin n=1 Tax=Streptomyces sp. NPDC056308 TaxID=3345780 RepID=UPI0035DDFFFA
MRWRSKDKQRYYTWDRLHGEIEAFNIRGRHLGALDAQTGVLIKDPRKDRRIDV